VRSVKMYPCTSTTCLAQDVIFVPDVKVDHHTQCGRCGEFICTLCTHMAGKCVPSHAPLPCTGRVELQQCILTLQYLVQDSERAVRRESNNQRRERESQIMRDFHEGMQQTLHLTIERQIVDAVGSSSRKTSCAEIFAAVEAVKSAIETAHVAGSNGSSKGAGSQVTLAKSYSAISSSPTITKPADLLSGGLYASTSRSGRGLVGRGNEPRYLPVHDTSPPTDQIITTDDSLRYAAHKAQDSSTPEVMLSILRFVATASWCRLFVAKHKLAISSPTLQQCIELFECHDRTKEVAILRDIQAGTYKVLPSCRIMQFRESETYPCVSNFFVLDGWISGLLCLRIRIIGVPHAQSEPRTEREGISDEELVMKTTKPCPSGCGYNIVKQGGCTHMACAKCGYNLCWLCLKDDRHSSTIGRCRGSPDMASFSPQHQDRIR